MSEIDLPPIPTFPEIGLSDLSLDDVEFELLQSAAHGPGGRFTKGNVAGKKRRARPPVNLSSVFHRALTGRSSQAIASRLIQIARKGSDADAVAAATLLLQASQSAPPAPQAAAGDDE